MLQFLLADYLTGYHLPSLRKTVTTTNRTTWTLSSQPNRYTLTFLGVGDGTITTTLVDKCHCNTLAIRLSNDFVFSLLEDGSERRVNVGMESPCDTVSVMLEYLTDGE